MYFVGNVMYYQLNIDYIIETYCVNKEKPELQCNGKCHLAKQLTAIDTTDDSGKAIMNLYDSFFPVFAEELIDLKLQNNSQVYLNKENTEFNNQLYTYSFEYFHFKPPIV